MRIKNLKLLYSIHSESGAMTTKSLSILMAQKGLDDVDEDLLGSFFRGDKELSIHICKRIEDAFHLPNDWLSSDFDFIENLSIKDIELIKDILPLSVSAKNGLHEFIVSSLHRP